MKKKMDAKTFFGLGLVFLLTIFPRQLRYVAALTGLIFITVDMYLAVTGQFDKLTPAMVIVPIGCYALVMAIAMYIKRFDPDGDPEKEE